jgi:ABC-type lipoprotein release transport system permease subunit
MLLIKLAFRNFFRNTRRSLISGISIALAITMIIFARSYVNGIFRNISANVIKLVSGHIIVMKPEYKRRERLLPLSEAVALNGRFYNSIKSGEITQISPRIKFGVLLGREELDVPALGYAMTPEIEREITGLDKRLINGSYINTGEKAMIIGKGLAARLDITVGESLTVITRTAYDSPTGISLLVKGIYETGMGGVDRSIFYIPLDIGQRLLDLDRSATEVVIMVKDPGRAIAIARQIEINTGLLAVPYQYNQLLRLINVVNVIYGILYAIILLVACSTIANTMLMVVFERTREIGMMKALGLTARKLIVLFLAEAGIIGALGGLVGVLVGSALSYWLKFHGIDISMASSTASQSLPFGPVIYLDPTPLVVLGSFLFGLIATFVIAILPISRVARLEPAKALKAV